MQDAWHVVLWVEVHQNTKGSHDACRHADVRSGALLTYISQLLVAVRLFGQLCSVLACRLACSTCKQQTTNHPTVASAGQDLPMSIRPRCIYCRTVAAAAGNEAAGAHQPLMGPCTAVLSWHALPAQRATLL